MSPILEEKWTAKTESIIEDLITFKAYGGREVTYCREVSGIRLTDR